MISDRGAFDCFLTQALFPEEGARRAGDACFLIALSCELGAGKFAPRDAEEPVKGGRCALSVRVTRRIAFGDIVVVSWEELTSS